VRYKKAQDKEMIVLVLCSSNRLWVHLSCSCSYFRRKRKLTYLKLTYYETTPSEANFVLKTRYIVVFWWSKSSL